MTFEAKQWFSSLDLAGIKVLYLYGIANPDYYEVAKDWLKDPDHFLIFLEDSPEAVAQAKPFLQAKQVRIQLFNPADLSDSVWISLVSLFGTREFLVTTTPAYSQNPLLDYIKLKLSLWSNIYQTEQAEYSEGGRYYYNNFYHNLSLLPEAYLMNGLIDKFQGVPAIICGAGPSLDKNLALLETLGDRALIFAGGTAMNAVNSRGFSPHFGVGIDPNEVQETRVLMNNAFEVPLLYRNRVYYKALQLWHGPKIYVPDSAVTKISGWVEAQLGIPQIEANEGHNVVNFSTSLACLMGCSPIIFVGVDLAYSEGRSYQEGVVGHPLHTRKDFRTKNLNEELLVKDDIFGKPVHTLWKWMTESNWYGKFAKQHPRVFFINATEGGIGMPNVPNQPLKEVATRFLQQTYDLNKRIQENLKHSPMPPTVSTQTILQLLQELKQSFQRCEESLSQNLLEEIQSETAYHVVLQNFDQFILRSQLLAYQQLDEDRELAEQQKTEKRCLLRAQRLEMLGEVVKVQRTLIEQAILDDQKVVHDAVEGEPSAKLNEVAGKLEGDQYYYYKNGSCKSMIRYHMGRLDGLTRLYYPNGKWKRELHFSQGSRQGIERMWSPEGNLLFEVEYQASKPIGFARKWHPNGQLAQENQYSHDSKLIQSRYWSADGELIPDAVASDEDYFESVTRHTAVLTDSLENVVTQLDGLVPLLPVQAGLKDDLENLTLAMGQLQSINQELFFESGLQSENLNEPIWKTPVAQKEVQKKLDEIGNKLKSDITYMQNLLKNMQLPKDKSNDG